MNIKLKMIADEISSGKCLVILGPRLLTKEGANINAKLNAYLKKELGDDIELNYYTEDGFLNFNRGDIAYIAAGIKQFYENELQPDKVYQKIAEIPFSLIINTSPDKALNKIFESKDKEYDYDYFRMYEPSARVRRKHNTLIYNIFGDYEDINSMVLTFKDLSSYMEAITNLKTKIKMALNDAKAVLFFGFSYDKWYFQLLLSFLQLDKVEKEGKMKNAWDEPKEGIRNFYMNEFNVKFFSDNTATEIIDQLYEATKKGDIKPPENLEDTPPDIYISYSHREKSNEIADNVEESFKASEIRLIRDKTDLPIKEKISKFMEQIGKAEGVVVILSDAYLKSKYCMFELIEIYENEDFEKRIFPIVLNDAKIFEAEDRLVYKQYWKDEMDKLDEKATDMSSAETLSEDYKLFKKIHDSFDKILEVLKDMKSLVQKDAEASGFDDFISEIKDKA
ncbi:MAG: TIR domain-containing protein [Flavobacteriaceae bacterium]|nr:TIR domain-containing protein [Flavobacteriaceae bacterium]MDH3796181.1 TIR domain-containing protein [Flavobacteriaceae bacterium]